MKHSVVTLALASSLLACNAQVERSENLVENRVATSGKTEVSAAQVPPDVIAAVKAEEPQLSLTSAEAETRDGRRYFDIGGILPDSSEIEFDVMEEDGRWRIVEIQRDIAFSAVPEPVREAVRAQDAAIVPRRVIESKQQDGLVIYEIYAPAGGDPQGQKTEVKWDGRKAAVLTQEWAH